MLLDARVNGTSVPWSVCLCHKVPHLDTLLAEVSEYNFQIGVKVENWMSSQCSVNYIDYAILFLFVFYLLNFTYVLSYFHYNI